MKQQLIKKLKELGIIKKGKFILKSGRVSDFYIDLRKAYGEPEILKMISELLCEKINNLKEKPNVIAASGYGGISIATLVANNLNLKLCLVREKSKDHGIENLIVGYNPKEDDRILIIDDIFASGTSINKTLDSLKQTPAKILGALVVIDREENPHNIKLNSLLKLSDFISQ
ncbi:MAG: orotate phosphoribosyltransferase [Candidatus Pacearchaeota archaeon]|jgi:orotate phosphoribosyltransferase